MHKEKVQKHTKNRERAVKTANTREHKIAKLKEELEPLKVMYELYRDSSVLPACNDQIWIKKSRLQGELNQLKSRLSGARTSIENCERYIKDYVGYIKENNIKIQRFLSDKEKWFKKHES